MADRKLLIDTDERGVTTVTLNRPEVHNAFDNELTAMITDSLVGLQSDEQTRIVILTGAGSSFSSGADIGWMRSMADFTEEENYEDALRLAELMATLNTLGKPTVARVNGHAFGGAVGLVACCDIVIAAPKARFCLSEVRLGLVPAVISPYVIEAMGARNARRFFLTAEQMSARKARRVGLVHEVAKAGKLDRAVEDQVGMLLKGGPCAMRESKELVRMVDGHHVTADQALRQRTAEIIAQMRVSGEGQEGLRAFLEKRPPNWIVTP
jgi:methylglutaconyl-CoA hydratase